MPEVAGACPAPPCFLEGSAGHRVRGTHCGPEKPSTPFSCRLSCAGLMAVVSVTPGQAVTPGVQAGDGQGACRLCRTGGRGPHSLPHAMCTYGVYVCAWPGRARGAGGRAMLPLLSVGRSPTPQPEPLPLWPPSHGANRGRGRGRGTQKGPRWGRAELRPPPAQRGASPSASGKHSGPSGPGTRTWLCIHLSPHPPQSLSPLLVGAAVRITSAFATPSPHQGVYRGAPVQLKREGYTRLPLQRESPATWWLHREPVTLGRPETPEPCAC